MVLPNRVRISSSSPVMPWTVFMYRGRFSTSGGGSSTVGTAPVVTGGGISTSGAAARGWSSGGASSREPENMSVPSTPSPTTAAAPAVTSFLVRCGRSRSCSARGPALCCRSAVSSSSSPSVVAAMASLMRCWCSTMDSWPSLCAASSSAQVASRSLSFARVRPVIRAATTRDRRSSGALALPSRLCSQRADVLW